MERLLPEELRQSEALTLERLAQECEARPLDDILDESAARRRPAPGDFGIEGLSALLLPLVIPAVLSFVKRFAEKATEGAAGAAGKATFEGLSSLLRTRLATEPDPHALAAVTSELEASFEEQARRLNLPKGSYAPFLRALRENPDILQR